MASPGDHLPGVCRTSYLICNLYFIPLQKKKKKKKENERLQQTQVISLKSTPAETHPERPSQTLPASTLGSRQTPLHCVPHIVTFLPRWLLSWDVPLQLLSLIPSFPATGGSCGPSREQVMQASTEKHNEPLFIPLFLQANVPPLSSAFWHK